MGIFLNLKIICQETISISTFLSKTTENSKLDRVYITLKRVSNFEFCIEALCTPFICHLIKNQSINLVQNNYDYFKDLRLAESGSNDDIELLIGCFYWPVVTGKVKIGKIGEPVCVETKFGWLLNGPVTKSEIISPCLRFVNENISHVLFCKMDQLIKTVNLENELHCFCNLESLGISGQENYVKDFSDIIYQNEDLR